MLQRYGREVRDDPAYSLDLAPCGLDFFGLFKNRLVGKGFERDADVKQVVTPWIQSLDTYFLYPELQSLVPRWDSGLFVSCNYVEF